MGEWAGEKCVAKFDYPRKINFASGCRDIFRLAYSDILLKMRILHC